MPRVTPHDFQTAVENVETALAVSRDTGRLVEPAGDLEIGCELRETEALDSPVAGVGDP